INYRSVMLFGRAAPVADPAEKQRQLERFTERMYPGRWRELRPVTPQEIKATTVLSMHIEEGSAKGRSGPPKDDAEDYDWPVGAGIIPVQTVALGAQADQRKIAGTQPAYLHDLSHIGLQSGGKG